MTVIYVPVKIESAEQAEVLPVGTVGHEPPHLYAYIKKAPNYWRGTGDDAALTDYEMLPFTALAPIEAEEDIILVYSDEPDKMWANETYYSVREAQSIADGRPDYLPAVEVRTRYVTPWEAA